MSKNYAVVLSPGVRDLFPASMIALLKQSDGFDYFLASKVEPNGTLYEMTIEHTLPNGKLGSLQLHIQHSYISYVLATADLKSIGFI
ncbi:hypothetical protein IV454_16465 [Massilia antarctica]|uniref:Uncharacterized protein n=1 Tax=Massilia antarctica TaxID=2765360 RepID=A0AA49ABT0_9BURK|nr:hypothetical protein [Massilia antarctica]QPI52940.1 hypothetical protein IV454_16465 [Massilia antarctica]